MRHQVELGDDRGVAQTVELFKALGHPTRLRIVMLLGDGDHAVHDLVEHLGIRQPSASQHLAVLRAARLVATTREGREARYHLVDDHVAHIVGDALQHTFEGP